MTKIPIFLLIASGWCVVNAQQTLPPPVFIAPEIPTVFADDVRQNNADNSWTDNFEPYLVEQLTQEGRRLIEQRNYPEAESIYSRAWQISRQNAGLFDVSQIPLLEMLLFSLLKQEKWEKFDQQLNYLEWLQYSAYASNPALLAEGLINQSDWHRRAAALMDDSRSGWYLVQAKFLNWQAVAAMEMAYGKQDQRLIPILYRIVIDHYLQTASSQRRGLTSFEYKTDGKDIANGWSFSNSENVRRSYGIGKEILQRIRGIYHNSEQASDSGDSLLIVQLADWDLLFGYGTRALERYRQAYDQLLQAGNSVEEVELFFDQVTLLPVPTPQLEWGNIEPIDNEKPLVYVPFSKVIPGAIALAVDGSNRVSAPETAIENGAKIQIRMETSQSALLSGRQFQYSIMGINVDSLEASRDDIRQRIYHEIPALQFRPKLLNGEPVAHDVVNLMYVYDSN